MNKTGHPSRSPISENDMDSLVRGHLIDREKFGEDRYLCILSGLVFWDMVTALWYYLMQSNKNELKIAGEAFGHPA